MRTVSFRIVRDDRAVRRDDTSPTSRALLVLELLQTSPGIGAERLASRLGVTERAVRRYVGILREAGIPVESERGPYGGYRVGRGVRLPPLVFSSQEALGLVMAVLDGQHAAADGEDPVGRALAKITRALPESVAAQAELVRQAAAAAPRDHAVRPDLATTAEVVRACAEHRRLRLTYRSEAGREWTLEVEPWAVVVRYARWYLLCRTLPRPDHGDRGKGGPAVRAYRVDRMRDVELLPQPAAVPDDLDPVALLEEHLAQGWEYDVRVRVADAPARVEQCLPRGFGRISADGDGTLLVASTSNPHWYAQMLAGLGTPYEVLGGPELRDAVRALGERARAAVTDD